MPELAHHTGQRSSAVLPALPAEPVSQSEVLYGHHDQRW